MSAEQNKVSVRRVYQEGFAGNLDVIDELVAPGYVCHHGTGREITGLEGLKHLFGESLRAFSDIQLVVHDQFAIGDKVATRSTMTATHTGEFRGIPPSGDTFSMWMITIERFAGDKVVETWQRYDTLTLMQLLGAIPPSG